ncbi:MAG: hypothetical protein GY906_19145 [bacterium]|nr:hypothetical protein [bacterium]
MPATGIRTVRLAKCKTTILAFSSNRFRVTYRDNRIRIVVDNDNDNDNDNYVTVGQKDQHVAYKAQLLGGMVLEEERKGDVAFEESFYIDWEDEMDLPTLVLKQPATDIIREYVTGQRIELATEDVSEYRVVYGDGVEAIFERIEGGFDFSFSTGFYGSFWRDEDDSYTIKFKGDRLKPTEEAYHSQSKFVVSRSKYSGNLLLVLQEEARVHLR